MKKIAKVGALVLYVKKFAQVDDATSILKFERRRLFPRFPLWPQVQHNGEEGETTRSLFQGDIMVQGQSRQVKYGK